MWGHFGNVSSLRPGLQPSRLLCPWDSPGKNAEMGCQILLELHCQLKKMHNLRVESCFIWGKARIAA